MPGTGMPMGRVGPHRVVVMGFGYAGKRFVRALSYLQEEEPGLCRLVAVCDVAAAARAEAEAALVRSFADLKTAVERTGATAVVVAVNEGDHADALREVVRCGLSIVLCEKPLTATLADAEALPLALRDAALTVNFVERESEVLRAY